MDKKDVLIQELRTTINKYKKVLKRINYNIDHMSVKPYDYGEASEQLLNEIKSDISELNL